MLVASAWRGKAVLARFRGMSSAIQLVPEVEEAIALGRPVVALESTIISHGMPYPRNLEMARNVEDVIRKHGATPATVAIIDGVPKIGLTQSDLLKLANNSAGTVLKASTRDIAHACATGATAATTVASTMKLAHLAGISVFATGGIGGVHRGAESTMDISADLLELSRTPVTVVCAGIKSILDIPKSLEVLETNSVPVLSYGTSVFPAFYTNDSGVPSPRTANATSEVASIMAHQRLLQLHSGVLVAVPNPSPAHGDKIQYAINFALQSAKNDGISGAKVTPYVLEKVQLLTGGESLESNIALVLNNARVAAEIAVEYAQLVQRDTRLQGRHKNGTTSVYVGAQTATSPTPTGTVPSGSAADAASVNIAQQKADATKVSGSGLTPSPTEVAAAPKVPAARSIPAPTQLSSAPASVSAAKPEVLVVGGAVVDLIGHITTHTKYQTSNPGQLAISHGGVGRNIAESLARLGRNVSLATAVAEDLNGRSILDSSGSTGIDMSLVRVLTPSHSTGVGHSTAMYNAIHDNHGDLCIGVADMSIFAQITPEYVSSLAPAIATSVLVAVDGNISKEAFAALVEVCSTHGTPVFFEPTSDHKCLLPFLANSMHKVDIIKPNATELVQLVSHALRAGMINGGRALVQNTLSAMAGDRIDQSGAQNMDIADVRVLANALYQVMQAAPTPGTPQSAPTAARGGFLSGILGHPTPPSTAAKSPPGDSESQHVGHVAASVARTVEGRAVSGKHVIVSLGSRGVLWCGPAKVLTAAPTGAIAGAYLKDGSCVVNDATQSATILVPALAVNAADIVHTNGAGDAFCAGLLAEVTRKQRAAGEDSAVTPVLPDIECIHKGLLSAHHWLVSK